MQILTNGSCEIAMVPAMQQMAQQTSPDRPEQGRETGQGRFVMDIILRCMCIQRFNCTCISYTLLCSCIHLCEITKVWGRNPYTRKKLTAAAVFLGSGASTPTSSSFRATSLNIYLRTCFCWERSDKPSFGTSGEWREGSKRVTVRCNNTVLCVWFVSNM